MSVDDTPTTIAVKRVAYLISDTVLELDASSANAALHGSAEESISDIHNKPDGITYMILGSGSLLNLLPVVSANAESPTVLHIAAAGDLSEVMRLYPAASFFLYSHGGQQAYDNALLASIIARTVHKAVVHVYHPGSASGDIHEISDDDAKRLCSMEKSTVGALSEDERLAVYEHAALLVQSVTGRKPLPFTLTSNSQATRAVIVLGFPETLSVQPDDGIIIRMSLLSPFPERALLETLTPVEHVLVLDQVQRWSLKWTPLFLGIVNALQSQDEANRPTLVHDKDVQGELSDLYVKIAISSVTRASSDSVPYTTPEDGHVSRLHIPVHESSYTDILGHLFESRLHILNDPSIATHASQVTSTPEFALGRARRELEDRADLESSVRKLLEDPQTPADLHARLSRWMCAKDDPSKSALYGEEVIAALRASETASGETARALALRSHFPARSRWIIGSDAWSYDIGASGLHHAIASGLDVNVLVLDTIPHSTRNADKSRRKQDVGLYAMNHGDVYVASVAVYASYGQVLQALREADAYPGPSIVLAYLPYSSENDPVVSLLKETKDAVDSGYWPLYRWDPSREARGEEVFQLDSASIKHELQTFLDRQNHLSQLVLDEPKLAANVVSSVGESTRAARKERAQATYADLLAGIDAPPIIILYASDGGNAEKKARRLAHRAKARGLSATLSTMDAFGLDAIAKEENVVFITSTAGQGEPPQNGRAFFKASNAAAAKGEKPFSGLKYTVFGMGDSHYWPRPEDAGYYNRPSKELDARLTQLGGERFAALGLGDEQDADGAETGYKVWEPLVWKHFGVDAVEVEEAEPEPITAEHIKAASNYLRGTIAEGLSDTTTGALAESDTTLTKFHGVYQQDDRDIREERQAAGIEPAYIFMIRVRVPGGVVTPEQWLTIDQIAEEHGASNYKLTTRQNFQIHGVLKRDLKVLIQKLNVALMDTLAAGGDGNRNVLVTVIPTLSKLHEQVYAFGKHISEYLLPRTSAYHEIWLDKKLVAGDALQDHEPLFRDTFYLPRKIKFAIAVPPVNDIDVFSNCVGFIAIVDEHGDLAGFNVAVGGGMGFTHGTKKTYPRVADVIGFIPPDKGMAVVETIFFFHRDNSSREDRKNARLKYTIDRIGLDVFKAEIEKMLGFPFEPARPFAFTRNTDTYGWQTGIDGRHHFTCHIENGRVRDTPSHPFKTGLRELAKVHKGGFRLTANQHVIITDITDEDLPEIKRLLAKYKLDNVDFSGLRLSSSACVALPTCPIAMAESERYFPLLLSKIEAMLEEHGLRNDSIVARMSGCPNSCSRPSLAELGFIGKAPGTYLMLLGGGHRGERLSKIYRESVTEPEILAILKPMIKRFALERLDGEPFGDFVIRAGYIAPSISGKDWYEDVGGEGEHRQIIA